MREGCNNLSYPSIKCHKSLTNKCQTLQHFFPGPILVVCFKGQCARNFLISKLEVFLVLCFSCNQISSTKYSFVQLYLIYDLTKDIRSALALGESNKICWSIKSVNSALEGPGDGWSGFVTTLSLFL